MAKPEPEYKPRIIVQTQSYRITAKPRPPFEGNPRPDEITIETRRTNGMDEPYWHPIHHLWDSRHSMSEAERFLQTLFQEIAHQQQETAAKELSGLIKEAYSPVVVERRPKLGPRLAELLIEVGNTLRGEVKLPPDMPFDNRDAVGLALTPGLLSDLHKMFPGLPYPLHPVQLIAKLLERAADELKQ
jgi:hypothetical protein